MVHNLSSPNLTHLAPEIYTLIASCLLNLDIKNLRLTCKVLWKRSPLHQDRIFLSANPRNIEVALAVADHETYRHKIVEIIWDDSRFVHHIRRPSEDDLSLMESSTPPRKEGHPPPWFVRACRQNIEGLRGVARVKDMQFSESWDYYRTLLEQQEEVLRSGADAEALKYVLGRFSSLRRITITPTAHGKLDKTLYNTPMIRSFPLGFNYPIPLSWPLSDARAVPYRLPPWNDEVAREQWRGFSIVLRELAHQENHQVSTLVVDVKELETGISCRIFDEPCEEYDNFVNLLRRPGFRHIDLTLLADGQFDVDNWSSFRSSYLRESISQAQDLRYVNIGIKADYDQIHSNIERHCIPLQSIFPIDQWPKLRHFGLSGFIVKGLDLLSLLSALPETLRSVEFSFLRFAGERGNYHDLLIDIRQNLSWRDRVVGERPRVIIHVPPSRTRVSPLRYRCVDTLTTSFLYEGTEIPFKHDAWGNYPRGGIERTQLGLCYTE